MTLLEQFDNVASLGHIKVKLDDTNPADVDHEHHTYFEMEDNKIIITIQQTKPSGRTYRVSTAIDAPTLRDIVNGLMDSHSDAQKIAD